ncbi:hypothetical protein FE839_12835 [Klebsiella indica]|uniref:Uncharacterized protein n=1 Tax=Klebsiella indica TaxID=2582917 RepID=A0A5R9LH51_9ENTR|nr:hypothetical protein FE839_12835 [Klebsiella indica]
MGIRFADMEGNSLIFNRVIIRDRSGFANPYRQCYVAGKNVTDSDKRKDKSALTLLSLCFYYVYRPIANKTVRYQTFTLSIIAYILGHRLSAIRWITCINLPHFLSASAICAAAQPTASVVSSPGSRPLALRLA